MSSRGEPLPVPSVGALPYAKATVTVPKEYWERAEIWPKSSSAEIEIPLE